MRKIADVQAHVLEAKLSQPFHWSFNTAETRASCLVEVVAEDGTTGWGECYGPAALNAAVVAAMRPLVIGKPATATDLVWQTLYNGFRDLGQKGLVVSALSGIDIALWDLKGKLFGAPVAELMGGPLRSTVPAYATGTYRVAQGDPLDYVIAEIEGYVRDGFGAIKLKIGFDVARDLALIAAAREAVGPDIGLMLDANHGFDALEAIELGNRAARYDIGWFEEPVVPDDLGSYLEVKGRQPIPVAGGETEFTRWGFREVLARRAMDIIQPDTCGVGGLSEAKKIADMATAFGVRMIPHVWGTGIGLAAALQLLAVLPDHPPRYGPRPPLLEFDRSEHPFRQAVLSRPIEHVAGNVAIPVGPGLGIEVDREAVARFSVHPVTPRSEPKRS
ncbi:MAG: mandelate racemase/muconate lactonizing enzyme family protein [Hyphomicrobiaceae bacterium]